MRSPFKDLPREISVLVAASFFVAVGFGIVLPAIPVFARSFGVSNAAIGLIISIFAITRFVSGLISGKLVDLFGERAVFSSGVFMVAISVFLAGLSTSYEQLLFFRAAGGLGSMMFSVAAGSVVMRSVDDTNRGRALAVYNGSYLVGGVSGPAIGGLLSLISLRAPFFAYAITLLISGTVAHFFLKGEKIDKGEKDADTGEHTTVREAFAMKPYRIALALSFIVSWVIFGLRTSILPIFVIEELNATTAIVGYGFTLAAIFQGALLLRGGRLSDSKGRRVASVIGTVIGLIGMIVLTTAVNSWMYLLAMAIIGVGGAFLSTTPASLVGDIIRGRGGQVIAGSTMASDAGLIVGPIIVGALADIYSYRTAFVVSTAVFAIAALLATQIPETRAKYLSGDSKKPQVNNLRLFD
ncbi:MAG: MFS transporter [Actinomycetota bacterium]|nr:MFS transporter [Actinomycetota bacterium]